MRVWLITVGEPLPLPGRAPRLLRTGLLARELERRGDDVTWWTSRVDHSAKQFFPGSEAPIRLSERLEMRFLHGRLYNGNVSWNRLMNHREIARNFSAQVESIASPHVILCSFPTIELSLAAVTFGAQRGIPVLLDVRDLWPDVLLGAVPAMLEPLGRLALGSLYRDARHALSAAGGIIGISEFYLSWALQAAGRARRSSDAVIPLGYPTPDLAAADVDEAWKKLAALGVRQDCRLVLFIGTFGRSYDLAPLIHAARELASDPSLQFVLAGEGERGGEWRAAARGVPGIVFTGWTDAPMVSALLQRASIGVAAYSRRAMQGLPNKFFEYLSGGLPVVSSLRGEAAALLELHECGLSYDPESPGTLVGALRQLLGDEALRSRMSRNARATFEAHFTSHSVTTRLIDRLRLAVGSP